MNSAKILSSITDEERVLTRHLVDLAKQAETSGRARFSCFLDERQQILCGAQLSKEGYENYDFVGGYEGAVRRAAVFHGFGEEAPFTPVVFNYREADKPTHRDFLGSLMALDIKREMVGDILVSNGRCVVFVMNSVLGVVSDISKIGKFGVKITYDFSEKDIPQQEFEKITATVQSLRLDSVLSNAIKTSREKAQELIRAKGVVLNHVEVFDPSLKIEEGDVFSVKGFGKFVLREIGGFSKKDRTFITIEKFK